MILSVSNDCQNLFWQDFAVVDRGSRFYLLERAVVIEPAVVCAFPDPKMIENKFEANVRTREMKFDLANNFRSMNWGNYRRWSNPKFFFCTRYFQT